MSRNVKKRKSVALLVETSNAYARGLLRGIVQYVREQHTPWSMHLFEQGRGDAPPAWLAKWQGDGIIARVENRAIARVVRKTGLPVVDVSAARILTDVPCVETNDQAIARAAAEHLIERGFRRFAFVGEQPFKWSQWRRDYFREYLEQQGLPCDVYETPGDDPRQVSGREQQRLIDWLRRLTHPVGIMACYDIKAQQVLDACRICELAVPEEIAVVGVDNDELLCNLSFPPLSSVEPDTMRTGYEAAAYLDRMMSGESVPPDTILLDPVGVVTRQSTDVLAIDDRAIASAVRYIREHAYDGINVSDVLKQVPLSRRAFEKRFQDLIGRTPHEEIVRLRIERVKQLLAETDLSTEVIAQRAGFSYVEYLSVAFKRATGLSPRDYRQIHRQRAT